MCRKIAAFLLPIFITACASMQSGNSTPAAVTGPDSLKPGPKEWLMMVVAAKGVQIYECRAKQGVSGVLEWAFVAPEADLFDSLGKKVGKHYGGPHWEANDGSKVIGVVKARHDSPLPNAVPWLLLTTKSDGPDGLFHKVSSIQRLNTVGGAAPKDGCTIGTFGTTVRVGYTADYYLYSR